MAEQSKAQKGVVPVYEPRRDVDYDKLSKVIAKELGFDENEPIPMLLLVWKGPESSRFSFYPINQGDSWLSQYDVAIQFLRDLVSYERTGEWTQKTYQKMMEAEKKKSSGKSGSTSRVVGADGRSLIP